MGRDPKSSSEKNKGNKRLTARQKTSYYLPANMDDDDDIYSNSSSSESSRDGDADRDGNESSGSEMMSLHSDASSDGFNNDAIDVEKAFQLDKLIDKPSETTKDQLKINGTFRLVRIHHKVYTERLFYVFSVCVVNLKYFSASTVFKYSPQPLN